MSTTTIILIAVGLSLDAFAVAIAASVMLGTVTGRQVFRLGFHFGLFQALMPVIGWVGGRTLSPVMHGWDHWVAFGLLTFVGLKVIREALGGDEFRATRGDPTRGVSLLMLSVATSIDAFAVGLSFAMLGVVIWYPAVVIGCTTGAITAAGMLIGDRLGARFGKRLGILGGLVLLAIGVKILVEHLWS
jgi:putative Mn2+ efflux pump MntP